MRSCGQKRHTISLSNSHVRGCGSNTCGQQRHTSSAWVATFVGMLCGLAVRRDTHVNCERYPPRKHNFLESFELCTVRSKRPCQCRKSLHDLIQPFRRNMDKANWDEYYCHILGKLQPDSNDICFLVACPQLRQEHGRQYAGSDACQSRSAL